MAKTVWSFDLGKASIGEAVRDLDTNLFLHVASLLIPAEFASTKHAASRRRMWRTRQAHKAREAWLDEVWRAAGQEPLQGRRVGKVNGKWQLITKGDERLEREFPKKGDSTCYTSCLLRIKLLRGEKLEPWQIYKALHSAIQKRGYDPDIAWKARESRRSAKKDADDEEKGTAERMAKFEKELHQMSPDAKEYRLPCYFDAWKMRLWNPAEPGVLRERIGHDAESTRNEIAPRRLVENEIRLLVDAAGRQVPALACQADFVLFGPAGRPYASYYPQFRKQFELREGGAADWKGVLGQKIPRFDNRIIEKCALMPRFNVCKVRTDEKAGARAALPLEVTFLMKLKNMRIQRAQNEQSGLTAEEIRTVFENPKIKGYKLTATQWAKICDKLGAHPVPPVVEVAPPKASGRSRFCRPALEVLKRLVLSGLSPQAFHGGEIARLGGNTHEKKGLVPSDLKFLLDMGTTWERVHIPNQKLEALAQRTGDKDNAIRELIGSQNDPVVRHRLALFWDRIKTLEGRHGTPSDIVIEFVREDFMGKKALLEYRDFIKKREVARKQARDDAAAAGSTERSAALKMELLRMQDGQCLYWGTPLLPTNLDQYQIDHIVPRSRGGPDAMVNYVLTTREANDDKGNKTPFEWLSPTDHWDAYVNRVEARRTSLRNKKMRLLLLPEAPELAEKYNALAETAWIAKLSQTLAGLQFGWKNGVDQQGEKRVIIISGGLTARIRRKYRLNSLLNPEAVDEEEAEKKNREDDRHHALDAMVLSFIPTWARDENKEKWFRFPKELNPDPRTFFADAITKVQPSNECLASAALEATAYGERVLGKSMDRYAVGRESLEGLLVKLVKGKESMRSPDKAETHRIVEPQIRRDVEAFLGGASPSLSIEQWRSWCASYRVGGKGAHVVKVLMTKTKADALGEYCDMSKDGTRQLRRGEMHQGYFVYLASAPSKKNPDKQRPIVRPVYAFQSIDVVASDLRKEGVRGAMFFQSGCTVELENRVDHAKTPLEPGRYLLNSIWFDGRAKVTSKTGKISEPLYLSDLLRAGFKRIDR